MNATIGKNLKLLREASRFSQEQVSCFLDIKRSTYSNYELGEREAPMWVLEKLSDLFGCELCLFFEEENTIVEDMLTCTFRVDNLSYFDMKELALFKNVVKNYLKLSNLLS